MKLFRQFQFLPKRVRYHSNHTQQGQYHINERVTRIEQLPEPGLCYQRKVNTVLPLY
jgi:hypothetical protein